MSLTTVTSPEALQGSHISVSLDIKHLKVADSSSIESTEKIPADVYTLRRQYSQGQPLYFTSDINEGYSNVEEVICDNNQQPSDTYLEENQQLPKRLKSHHTVRFGTTGEGVQYGHQMGQTSITVSRERQSSTESNEESENELLIATPLTKTQSSLKRVTSPLLLSFADAYDEPSEIDIVIKELNDTMPNSDSSASLYPIISDESNDSIFDHLPEFGIEIDTKSETSVRPEGNIPNLEALGVKEISSDSPVPFVKSLSTSAKISRLPASQTLDAYSVWNPLRARLFAKRDKSHSIPARSPKRVENDSIPFQFCTTSTQSAIVEKIKLKQIGTADDDDNGDDDLLFGDKNTFQLQDSDKSSISSKSEHVESDVDTAYKASVKQRSMIPLLKEELKLKIQVERMKRGEPEVVLQAEEPKKYGLRPDEIEKKARRLGQNRRSAHKSRIKANAYKQHLEKNIKDEMNKSTALRQEIRKLRVFRETLRKELDDHLKVCPGIMRQKNVSK